MCRSYDRLRRRLLSRLLFADKLFNFTNINENNLLFFPLGLSQKFKQLNTILSIIPTVKRKAQSVFCKKLIFCKNTQSEQSRIPKRSKQTCHILHHVPCQIKSNYSFKGKLKILFFVVCNLSYVFFFKIFVVSVFDGSP